MTLYIKGLAAIAHGARVFRGNNLVIMRVASSTMDVVADAIEKNFADRFTAIALEQTHGRGSGDRKWHSRVGNLMFSRLVEIQAHEFGQEIEMIAACAVAEIVQKLLPTATVTFKYPNDIFVNGAKICGCLVPPVYDEQSGVARKINLGIGVNLKVAPPSDEYETTSLANHNITIGIAEFMRMFDVKFYEILNEYRRSKDFNHILRHMGFLDPKNRILLTAKKSVHSAMGTYNGFHVAGGKVFMRLNPQTFCAVRGYSIIRNAPRRGIVSSSPRYIALNV